LSQVEIRLSVEEAVALAELLAKYLAIYDLLTQDYIIGGSLITSTHFVFLNVIDSYLTQLKEWLESHECELPHGAKKENLIKLLNDLIKEVRSKIERLIPLSTTPLLWGAKL